MNRDEATAYKEKLTAAGLKPETLVMQAIFGLGEKDYIISAYRNEQAVDRDDEAAILAGTMTLDELDAKLAEREKRWQIGSYSRDIDRLAHARGKLDRCRSDSGRAKARREISAAEDECARQRRRVLERYGPDAAAEAEAKAKPKAAPAPAKTSNGNGQANGQRQPGTWISGNTYQHRSAIKAAGGRWNRQRQAWYFKSTAPAAVADLPGLQVEVTA